MMKGLAATVMLLSAAVSPARAEGAGIRLLPVPSATISAGEIVSASDLTERKFQTTPRSLSGIATEAGEITGKQARRRLLAGRPVPLSALTRPLSVRRGAKVNASYQDAGLSISTQVMALEDGAAGDTIDTRNLATGALVRAEVLQDGSLAVKGE